MEVPSEAQTQWRHIGINFDIIIFTGVEKEIMAAHGNSMEVLHKHNKRVLEYTQKNSRKVIDGKTIEKTLILNTDNKYHSMYSNFSFEHKITYSIENKSDFRAQNIEITPQDTKFNIKNNSYHLNIVGRVNVLNASGAIAAATSLGISNNKIKVGLSELEIIPGRMERIDVGQDFMVFVDYAHDQPSLLALLNTGKQLISGSNKIIVLFGGQGGGRDILRRSEMGEIAGKYADFVVVSNDDPYEDPPMQIIEDIAKGAKKSGKVLNKDLFLIEDRRSGIHKALELAKPNDLVFVACKGADQLMMVAGGKSLPWDEREVTREELKKLLKN
jgi:UDP-N-acetylmuramoyl-L-alanyl-D-glutamate--2,6-diaminopimelate ligase